MVLFRDHAGLGGFFRSFTLRQNNPNLLCILQKDLLRSLVNTKPSVNDDDMEKLRKFTEDFGQEG